MGSTPSKKTYEFIDAGAGKRLERFGPYILERPCAQAVWEPSFAWPKPDAYFTREGGNRWIGKLPTEWEVEYQTLTFLIRPTDFGHLGLFPEHGAFWPLFTENLRPGDKLLNLFAYTGGATLAAAKAGLEVCHVDASKPTVQWARDNAKRNGLENAPIRWIVDDAVKFLQREVRRGTKYDAVILDPPTFGRGDKGQVFKIEEQVGPLLDLCRAVCPNPKLLLFSSHTPGFTPLVMENLLEGSTGGESVIASTKGKSLPLGSYARLG